jgi:hypothetical protein
MASKLVRLPSMDLRIELVEITAARTPQRLMRIVASGEGRILLEIQDLAQATTMLHAWDRRPQIQPRRPAPAWLEWLTGMKGGELFRLLALDPKRRSLARDGTTILWVAGAGPRDVLLPQVHLERVTGALRRIVQPDTPWPIVSFEGRFDLPGSKHGWPGQISFEEAGKTVRYEIKKVEENASLSAGDLEIAVDELETEPAPGGAHE